MAKKITNRGALQAAFDVLCMSLYFIGGIAGVMIASVSVFNLNMWFYIAASVYLLFTGGDILVKVTKPVGNYETVDVV
jgi:hypothetical protein